VSTKTAPVLLLRIVGVLCYGRSMILTNDNENYLIVLRSANNVVDNHDLGSSNEEGM